MPKLSFAQRQALLRMATHACYVSTETTIHDVRPSTASSLVALGLAVKFASHDAHIKDQITFTDAGSKVIKELQASTAFSDLSQADQHQDIRERLGILNDARLHNELLDARRIRQSLIRDLKQRTMGRAFGRLLFKSERLIIRGALRGTLTVREAVSTANQVNALMARLSIPALRIAAEHQHHLYHRSGQATTRTLPHIYSDNRGHHQSLGSSTRAGLLHHVLRYIRNAYDHTTFGSLV